jgi:hypothetical protein
MKSCAAIGGVIRSNLPHMAGGNKPFYLDHSVVTQRNLPNESDPESLLLVAC